MVRTLALVGIAIAFGCSNHGSSSDLTPAEYAAQIPEALCAYETRCGLFADQDSCLAFGILTVGSDFEAAIAAGKTTFDADSAQTCLDTTSNTPCDQTTMDARVTPDACTHVLTGTGAAGATCADNTECASAACSIPDCQQQCCEGTCVAAQAPAGLGEPCVTRACDVGLACAADTKTCAPLGPAGAACTTLDDCAYGLGCGAGSACEMLPLVGEPCPDGLCAELGAFCNGGTCVMYGLPGAPCTSSLDCSPYATCDDAASQCAALPTVGQPCITECSDGSFCDMIDGSDGTGDCTAPLADGATCTRSTECANHYCADNGTCMTPQVCI